MADNLGLIITFSILNAIVIIYGLFLIIYGKFFRKDDLFILVNIYYNNIYFILIFINLGKFR